MGMPFGVITKTELSRRDQSKQNAVFLFKFNLILCLLMNGCYSVLMAVKKHAFFRVFR